MKKLFSVLLMLLCIGTARAQYVSIPDDAFKTFLMNTYPQCFNASGEMDTTCTAIVTEDSLTFGNSANGTNYAALAYFDGLTFLNLNNITISNAANFPARLPTGLNKVIFSYVNRYLTSYPEVLIGALPSGVQYIDYSYCNLGSLNGKTWPSSLRYLNLSNNYLNGQLGNLPPSLDTLILRTQSAEPGGFGSTLSQIHTALPSGLKYLDYGTNSVYAVPSLPAGLQYLDCSYQFYYVGLSMYVPVPAMSVLPTLPSGLVTLKCNDNALTSLPALPSTLEYLDCGANKFYLVNNHSGTFDYPGISTLPTLPAGLKYLNCRSNALTFLPTLPTGLQYLNCGNNVGLTNLPPLPATLNYLRCASTAVSCVGTLPPSMTGSSVYNSTGYNLEIRSTNINCIPNFVPGIRINSTTVLPLCNTNNNTHGCSINPIIAGIIFYDNNSNGVQDPGENPRPNVRVVHNGNAYAYTDINGHYEVTADIGSNTISIDAPPYYAAVPPSVSHTVTLPNSIVTDQIALQPQASVDSLVINITALQNPRLGGNHTYTVQYQNVGTTSLPALLTFQFNQSVLSFQSSNAAVIQGGPGTLTLNAGVLNPGQGGLFTMSFLVNTTASVGMHLITTAEISGGSANYSDSALSVIIGPIDPNDKDATPYLTQLQVADGKYINYLIRFQNVGTASAIDVFINDTLSALLDENSLQMLEVSHPCIISQTGKQLSFVFEQINLPDSTSDEPASHGFIRFRVKPINTLSSGNTVLNKASIYFDFNPAVVTNEAKTVIISGPIPLTLLYLKGRVQPGNRALLQWATSNELHTSEFEIEMSEDGSRFQRSVSTRAIGSGDNQYETIVNMPNAVEYYRLKIVDADGRYNYSPVIRLANNKYAGSFLVLNNPVRNELVIRLSNTELLQTNASLYDSKGNRVRNILLTSNEVRVSVSGLASGTYFIQTINGTQKFIISQ